MSRGTGVKVPGRGRCVVGVVGVKIGEIEFEDISGQVVGKFFVGVLEVVDGVFSDFQSVHLGLARGAAPGDLPGQLRALAHPVMRGATEGAVAFPCVLLVLLLPWNEAVETAAASWSTAAVEASPAWSE
jgi:hypothetical protein